MKQVVRCLSLSCNKRQNLTHVVGHVKKACGTISGVEAVGAAAWFSPLLFFTVITFTIEREGLLQALRMMLGLQMC